MAENKPIAREFSSPKGSPGQRLLRGVAVAAIGTLLLKGTRFFLVPLYTRYLTPADYGTLGIVMPTLGLLTILAWLSMGASVNYFMFQQRQDPDSYRRTLSTIFILSTMASAVISLLLYYFGQTMFDLVFGVDKVNWSEFAWPIIISILTLPAQRIVMVLYQARELRLRIVLINFVSFGLLFGLMCYQLIWLRSGAVGQVLAAGQKAALLFIPYFIALLYYLGRKLGFSIEAARHVLLFSLPLLPHALAQWGLNLSDRYFISQYKGLDAVGYYTFAYTCGMAMMAIVHGLQSVWGPVFFDVAKNHAQASTILGHLASKWALLLGLIAACGITFTPEIIRVLAPPSYWHGSGYVVPVIIGYLFLGLYTFPGMILHQMKRTGLVSVCTVVAVTVNIIANIYLVPTYGALAAAWNTALAFFVLAVLYFIIGQRLRPLEFQWAYIIAGIVLTVVAGVVAHVPVSLSLVIAKTIVVASLLIGLMYYFGGPTRVKALLKGKG
jgi:O-antigen/teichoic acid export membrane protein